MRPQRGAISALESSCPRNSLSLGEHIFTCIMETRGKTGPTLRLVLLEHICCVSGGSPERSRRSSPFPTHIGLAILPRLVVQQPPRHQIRVLSVCGRIRDVPTSQMVFWLGTRQQGCGSCQPAYGIQVWRGFRFKGNTNN